MPLMRSLFPVFQLALLLGLALPSTAQSISEKIKVNQIGYLISQPKVAYVSQATALSIDSWSIKHATTNAIAYQSTVVSPGIEDASTAEFVYSLHFNDFVEAGSYYIEVAGIGRSYDFEISKTVYNDVFKSLMKGFYYQRSGVALNSQYAGQWAKPAEYADDAYIYNGYDGNEIIKGEKMEAAGGWRDAGDPNKKVVPASIAVYQLLTLYEYFPTYIHTSTTNIPEDPDFPGLSDFLTEAKVSLDWLLKMQRADGAVWHAVGQEDFYLDDLGHNDPAPRYLMPVSTTATGDFAAVMATAYRVFKDIDSNYADQCLAAAEAAWDALNNASIWNNPSLAGDDGNLQYPEASGYSSDPPGINNTAVYEDTEDADERHWAAGELAISTNKAEYHDYFKAGIESGIWYPSLWPAVGNLANFSYALAFKDENNTTVNLLKNYISAYMEIYLDRIETTGFGSCLSPADYYWGSNNLAGQFAYTFLAAHQILGDEEYKDAALSMLNYLLGANSLNKTFISGIGDNPVENIFHLPSLLDGVEEVVPGLIPGGPNQYVTPTDIVHANLINMQSPPPAKCYVDSEYSFASNEAVILESAVWAFVTGYFYYEEIDADNDGFNIEDDCNDGNAQINPDQQEIIYNGVDDDCNPATLDDDLDQDGYLMAEECNDGNAEINPGVAEIPYNGFDDDCDAATLDDDLDQDGFVEAADCDDMNPAINPDAIDVPNNGVDEDCDGADLTTGLVENFETTISIYPNPAADQLFLAGDLEDLAYHIYSLQGRLVSSGSYGGQDIDLSNLEKGVYVIRLRNDEVNVSFRVLKNR